MFLYSLSFSDYIQRLIRSLLTLVFAISTLDFLMHTLLNLSFQDASSRGLVKVGYL